MITAKLEYIMLLLSVFSVFFISAQPDKGMVGFYGSEQQMNVSERTLVNLGLMWTLLIKDYSSCGSNLLLLPLGYGCFCGLTDFDNLDKLQQKGHTIDDFDKACLEHDYCYENAEKSQCAGINVKYTHFTWYRSLWDGLFKCGLYAFNYHSDCMETVCQCDTNFVNSIAKVLESENCPEKDHVCKENNENQRKNSDESRVLDSEEKLDESERILPWVAIWAASKLFQCYETSCWTSTKDLMVGINLWDKQMYRDNNIEVEHSTIEWTQYSRCWWTCEEGFAEVSYRENDGNSLNPVFKVLVADGQTIPDSFSTTGYNDKLGIALFHDDIDTEVDVMVFTIMPKDWKIYQNRFYTSNIRKFVGIAGKTIAKSAGKAIATAAIAGGALGSVIPVAGTAAGMAIAAAGTAAGLVFANNFDDFFGQFVHHIA